MFIQTPTLNIYFFIYKKSMLSSASNPWMQRLSFHAIISKKVKVMHRESEMFRKLELRFQVYNTIKLLRILGCIFLRKQQKLHNSLMIVNSFK
jgi:hypothetical protein